MDTYTALLRSTRSALYDRLCAGAPIDASVLVGHTWDGTAIGNPRWVTALSWQKFQKAVIDDGGRVRGWNIACEQSPVTASWVPVSPGGVPKVYGPFDVVPAATVPGPTRDGVVLDYGVAEARAWDPMARVFDPLVQVDEDLLLGVSYLRLRARAVSTPTWFTLRRGAPVTFVPDRV